MNAPDRLDAVRVPDGQLKCVLLCRSPLGVAHLVEVLSARCTSAAFAACCSACGCWTPKRLARPFSFSCSLFLSHSLTPRTALLPTPLPPTHRRRIQMIVDEKMPNAASYKVLREDHTVGHLLRM
jgi:hypothetical protein